MLCCRYEANKAKGMKTDAAGNAIAEEGDVVLPVAEPPKDADVRSPTWEENKVRRGGGGEAGAE